MPIKQGGDKCLKKLTALEIEALCLSLGQVQNRGWFSVCDRHWILPIEVPQGQVQDSCMDLNKMLDILPSREMRRYFKAMIQ